MYSPQVDIAQSPLFNLAAVMTALANSFERLWTPELCSGLVRRCRAHEARFFLEDHKIFGVNGDEEDMECCVGRGSVIASFLVQNKNIYFSISRPIVWSGL